MLPLRFVLPALVLLLASEALAGQLHIERYGLLAVARQGGLVAQVKVRSVKTAEGNDVVAGVRVLRTWPAGRLPEGKSQEVRVYGGIVWDDPRVSPMDRRLRGGLTARALKVGDEVLLVQEQGGRGLEGRVEALPMSEENLAKIEILFDERATTRFKGSPRPELLAALGDPDLAPLAMEALGHRGGVRAPEILEAAPRAMYHDLVAAMALPERARFFRQAQPWAREHLASLKDLVDLGARFFEPPVGLALAPLALLADPRTEEGHRILATPLLEAVGLLEQGKGGGRLADAYAPVFAAWVERRESYEEPARTLKILLEETTPKARRQLLRALLERVPGGGEGLDLQLLAELAPAVEARPDPEALTAILALEPFAADVLSTQNSVLEWMVRMAAAIVSKRPADRGRLAGRVEPYLRYGLALEDEALRAYLGAVGKAPASLVSKEDALAQRSEHRLAPGQRGTDLAGFRVDFDLEDDGGYSYRIKPDHHRGTEGRLKAGECWRIEGVESGRLFVLSRGKHDREGQPRLEIVLHPYSETKPTPQPEEALRPLALEAAKEAQCPATGSFIHEPELGRLRYLTTDPVVSGCTVVVGAFTGEVRVRRERDLSPAP
ncbi:MAG: hypothetical protein P1V51_06960 [Deltaproteobacteria bacterium]|nr:hypothetical protein [Deltaproteobacteria bacterium]